MHSKEPLRFILPLIRTPHILVKVLRAMYLKHFKVIHEYRRGDGYSRIPIQLIGIKIVNACNLRCKTCGQWGETGYNFGKPSSELKQIVPVERYLQMVDELKKDKPLYYIWGGEPFLYPGLFDLTARIKENKSLLAVVTNATLLEKHAKEVVEQGWDGLMFSIDGPETIHDEIRGKKGTYRKVKTGIKAIQKYKKSLKKHLPLLMPLVTISILNAHKIDEIFEVVRDLDTDCVICYYSWFTNEKIGEAHTLVMEKKLGITPTAWKGYLFDHNVNTEALLGSLNRIRSKDWGFPSIFIPNLKDEEISEYYKNPGNFLGYGPCISPWMTVEIMPNGNTSPCRDYPDYTTGNLMEESIYEIWNNHNLVKFRKALIDNGGTFPICSRCCGLMGW